MTYGRYGAESRDTGITDPGKPGCRWGRARQAGTERARRVAAAPKSPR
jgi:hypothetical protein